MTEFAPSYEFLRFMTPLSQERANRLVEFLADGLRKSDERGALILDVGCGWAELLLQVLAAVPTARGIGVDLDEAGIGHGRVLAESKGLTSRVQLESRDARGLSGIHNAIICIGASQIWGPPVDEHQPLDYVSALGALRELVPQGARVIYGEGVWSVPPTVQATDALSGREDEFVQLGELLEIATAAGFQPMMVMEANTDEWDEFESGYQARSVRWLIDNPGRPDARNVSTRVADQRSAYFNGYRNILGMAYLGLIAV